MPCSTRAWASPCGRSSLPRDFDAASEASDARFSALRLSGVSRRPKLTAMSSERHFLPLPSAAAIAYARLAGRRLEDCAENLLDAVATVLAAWTPIYAGDPPRRLSDDELAMGSFRRGGSVLQRSDGRVLFQQLHVERTELEPAIERLQRAGVSFSQVPRGSARRLPTVLPAT